MRAMVVSFISRPSVELKLKSLISSTHFKEKQKQNKNDTQSKDKDGNKKQKKNPIENVNKRSSTSEFDVEIKVEKKSSMNEDEKLDCDKDDTVLLSANLSVEDSGDYDGNCNILLKCIVLYCNVM